MRWLCFLLANAAVAQSAPPPPAARGGAKPLRFAIAALGEARDSFVFHVRGEERGWAVWQYEQRRVAPGADPLVVFTAVSELRPAEAESLRVTLNGRTGAPISSFHRIEFFSPTSDTTMVEHDLGVQGGRVVGRRRVRVRNGTIRIIPVSVRLPAGAVWSDYGLLAAPVADGAPGDSLAAPAYSEFGDSLTTLTLVAEPPDTVLVSAGRFETMPLRGAAFRVYVTRTEPRRVVKGESLDRVFDFELAGSRPVVRSDRP
ncbi:MAG: hypothetical protein AUH78_21255 [Gemmatimonadetes bacterium 13_1_40CM_4_69_8]|nr:MAG: hypothetical protein AUH78_21255 [Gemmatimonadetes bacterium 13_1_40CM_4_69_8]